MKNLFWIFLLYLAVISCENNPQEKIAADKVVGEWQVYRNENLETIIDQFTGTEWTTVDKWFRTIRKDSQIIIEFKADGTFANRYAEVETGNGVWGALEDGRYYFDHAADVNNVRDGRDKRKYITFYCDNTYSVQAEGDERSISYYKIIGTTECSDAIEYNVIDSEG
jgi:hypothetical protein